MSGPEGYVEGAAAPGFRRPDGPVRSFVALPCPPGLESAVADAIGGWRSLPADVKWSDAERIHLTLRFLGDAGPDALEALHARLEETAAAVDGPVRLEPGATGAFPHWGRARVLWVGFEEPGRVEDLARRVEDDARAAGFEPDDRPFVPHLTLGRVRGPRGISTAIEAVQPWRPPSGAEEVDEMILYESRLSPSGATHVPLAAYALGGAA